MPALMKITSAGVPDVEGPGAKDDQSRTIFDDELYAGSAPAPTALVTAEEGDWLLQQLS